MVKKILNSRVFYMILSVVLAVLFWVYVDVVSSDDYTPTISAIPVTFEGEDALESRGLMIVHNPELETVTLKLSGKRSDVMGLNRSNITITARTAQIVGAGQQQLEYTISYPSSVSANAVTVLSRSVDTITVDVVAEVTKTVQIQSEFTGSVADGYYFDSILCSPESIVVSGPEEIVDRISYALVSVPDKGVSSTIMADYSYRLMDENKQEISKDGLSCSAAVISAVVKVGAQKEVPLTVTFKDGGGATKDDITYSLSTESIIVSGDKAQLDAISSISLGEIDLSQVYNDTVITRDVVLDAGLSNISGITQVDVSVSISGLATVNYDVSNFVILNQPVGSTAQMVTGNLNVVLRGKAEDLAQVTAESIVVSADLSSATTLSTGTITVPAEITVNGTGNVGAVGTYSVVVRIQPAG